MLVVVSEMNCLNKLNTLGVYPDKFYTDLNLFKNQAFTFQDAYIIMILAGFQFYKRHSIEIAKSMMKRANNPKDKSIEKVYILSDVVMESFSEDYFLIKNDLNDLDLMKKKRVKQPNVDFFGKIKSSPKESEVFLTDKDKGIIDNIKPMKIVDKRDEELEVLIQKVNAKQLLKDSEKKRKERQERQAVS